MAGRHSDTFSHTTLPVLWIFPDTGQSGGLKKSTMLKPQDGQSLVKLFHGKSARKNRFRSEAATVAVDNNYKMISLPGSEAQYELYDLKKDSTEQNNLTAKLPKVAKRLHQKLNRSMPPSPPA